MVGIRSTLGIAFFLTVLLPSPVRADIFQWTDARGVIHFTDDWLSVPESARNSPGLITRSVHAAATVSSPEPAAAPPAQEIVPLPTPGIQEALPPAPIVVNNTPTVIVYQPQDLNVIVIQPLRRIIPARRCVIHEPCNSAFQPNFSDRRFVHPSIFFGGSRQFRRP